MRHARLHSRKTRHRRSVASHYSLVSMHRHAMHQQSTLRLVVSYAQTLRVRIRSRRAIRYCVRLRIRDSHTNERELTFKAHGVIIQTVLCRQMQQETRTSANNRRSLCGNRVSLHAATRGCVAVQPVQPSDEQSDSTTPSGRHCLASSPLSPARCFPHEFYTQ